MCGRCGALGHKSVECGWSKDKTCSACGKKGHFQKICKTKNNKPPLSRHRHQRVNQINNTPAEENESNEEDYEDIYVFKTGENNQTHIITINNTDINILIDSGSSINILYEPAYNQLDPKPVLTPSKTNIYPYQANQPLTLKGKFEADIQ